MTQPDSLLDGLATTRAIRRRRPLAELVHDGRWGRAPDWLGARGSG